MKEVSEWNGYTIQGDAAEIDAIISTPGLIVLDENDIVAVLEAEGESFVATGMGATLDAALDAALADVHVESETISNVAIALWCNSTQVPMAAFGAISRFTSTLSSDVKVMWGVFNNAALADSFRVILVGTAMTV